MRRLRLAILALAACSDSGTDTDPTRELLDELLAQNQIVCSGSSDCGVWDNRADEVVLCMNNALSGGARAQVSWTAKDSRGFNVTTHVLTVDTRIMVFEAHSFGDTPYVNQRSTCNGPFRLGKPCSFGQTELLWDCL